MNNDFYSSYNEEPTQKKAKANIIINSETNVAFAKAYLWMFVGVFLSFLIGLFSTKVLANIIINSSTSGMSIFLILFLISFIAQTILCFTINKNALAKANFKKAMAGFIVFSILDGFTFSTIFIYFDSSILFQVFGSIAIYYLILTALSFLFRNKIEKASSFAFIGLIALLIASLIVSIYSLIFFNSTISMGLYLGINILGLIVFTILTLVDIRSMYRIVDNAYEKNSASIAAAFALYLDFINIFVYVLRILIILGKNTKSD